MAVPKGGRGLKAPYTTTHVRIPVPIKDIVLELSQRFKEMTTSEDDLPFTDSVDIQALLLNQALSKQDAIQKAHQILQSKKGAKVSMQKLLTAIYGENIVL